MSNDNPFAPQGQTTGYGQQSVGFGDAPGITPAAVQPLGQAAPAGDLIKDTTTAQFQADVLEASREQPVLVDFWAPWCGPCKQLTPAIEAAVRAAGGKVKLVKMNIDEHPAIAGQLGVQSIPAVFAFSNGQPVDGFMGAKSESDVKAFIDKVLAASGGKRAEAEKQAIGQALEQAAQAVTAGDLNAAAQIYAMVLRQLPQNADAYGGMAGVMVKAGQVERAREMIDQAPDGMKDHPALNAVVAQLALNEKLAAIGDPAALEARLATNADDHDARFDLAQIYNAKDERDAAADALLAIMKADRSWRDDGARKELLTFFEAWGPTDPATVGARRKLSSILFS
ncbi:MAG: thioredoxin [Ahrensia sp.]